jgi:N-acetylglucosaminyl-diphospho-decaprenol L-rhamnosyltransferase
VLLTRFNLPSPGPEGVVRARKDWLERRIVLFESYCLTSVRAQTCQNFTWLIYFDPESPKWLRNRIESHASEGIYVPVFRASPSRTELISDIAVMGRKNANYLMTTNLDNDDGLAVNFIERLQEVEPRPERTAIYIANGLIKSGSRLYLRTDERNAFCSVLDGWASASTCWSNWHNLLGKNMRVLDLYGEPGWLQVIHGANVSNRVRGRLVSPGKYYRLFPGHLDDVSIPKTVDLVSDFTIARPRRFARESVRAMAKFVIMRTAGKEGLDRIKAASSRVLHSER